MDVAGLWCAPSQCWTPYTTTCRSSILEWKKLQLVSASSFSTRVTLYREVATFVAPPSSNLRLDSGIIICSHRKHVIRGSLSRAATVVIWIHRILKPHEPSKRPWNGSRGTLHLMSLGIRQQLWMRQKVNENLHMPTCACVLQFVLKRLGPLAGISAKFPRKQASCVRLHLTFSFICLVKETLTKLEMVVYDTSSIQVPTDWTHVQGR
jgi:hypothetical protein